VHPLGATVRRRVRAVPSPGGWRRCFQTFHARPEQAFGEPVASLFLPRRNRWKRRPLSSAVCLREHGAIATGSGLAGPRGAVRQRALTLTQREHIEWVMAARYWSVLHERAVSRQLQQEAI